MKTFIYVPAGQHADLFLYVLNGLNLFFFLTQQRVLLTVPQEDLFYLSVQGKLKIMQQTGTI